MGKRGWDFGTAFEAMGAVHLETIKNNMDALLQIGEQILKIEQERLKLEKGRQHMEEKRAECKNCKTSVNEDFKFCPYCGASLTSEISTNNCPRCGEKIEEAEASFCPMCGTSLREKGGNE